MSDEIHIGKGKQVKSDNCPNCGKVLDGITGVGDQPGCSDDPYPGGYTICAYCCSLCKFDDDLKLVQVSDEEREFLIKDNPLIQKMINAVGEVWKNHILIEETWADPWD